MKKSIKQSRRCRDAGVRRHRAPRHGDAPTALGPCHPIMRVGSVARTSLVPGAVVLVRLPFQEADGRDKVRPMVVVEVRGHAVVALPGTTSTSRFRYPALYAEVRDREAAGLPLPTGIRRERREVELLSVLDHLGQLSDDDAGRILGIGDGGFGVAA